ncbi:hypothetical protein HDU79_004291 [Rhizoclosmatium sp. JEL0117]|nr:hypothetical protein HDU79_004291 [Rhizoclosmatium sp. JEL0117]
MSGTDFFHPAIARYQTNSAAPGQSIDSATHLPSSSLPAKMAKRSVVQEDMYPAGIRAIENHGTAAQIQNLHALEQGKPLIDHMHPGVARNQMNQTHHHEQYASINQNVVEVRGQIQEDCYPAGIRAIQNRGTRAQVQELMALERGIKAVDHMHPGVARDQMNSTHHVDVLGRSGVFGSGVGKKVDLGVADFYPSVARGVKNHA